MAWPAARASAGLLMMPLGRSLPSPLSPSSLLARLFPTSALPASTPLSAPTPGVAEALVRNEVEVTFLEPGASFLRDLGRVLLCLLLARPWAHRHSATLGRPQKVPTQLLNVTATSLYAFEVPDRNI